MTAAEANLLTLKVQRDGVIASSTYDVIKRTIKEWCRNGVFHCEYKADPRTVDAVVARLKADGYKVRIGPGKGDPLTHPFGVYEISWENK